jgi:hypothetical protein
MRVLPLFLAVPAPMAQAPTPLPEAPMSAAERDQAKHLLNPRESLRRAEVKVTDAFLIAAVPDRSTDHPRQPRRSAFIAARRGFVPRPVGY